MSRKTCRRVGFSPDISQIPKHPCRSAPKSSQSTAATGTWRRVAGICNIRLLPTSPAPVRFLQRAGARVTRVIRLMMQVGGRKRRVSPNSRSRPLHVSVSSQQLQDSHRAEAIEDCIHFMINSSRSLQRSNSVPTNLSYY